MAELREPISAEELARRQKIVDGLIEIGIAEGVFHVMALDGQLLELKCETPRCYCDHGRTYFPKPPVPDSDWDPTLDHYPILKSNGGHKDPWNVRLAHKLCNREDFAWRDRVTRMIKEHRSLADGRRAQPRGRASSVRRRAVDRRVGAVRVRGIVGLHRSRQEAVCDSRTVQP